LSILRLAVQIVTTRPGGRVAPTPSGTGSNGDDDIMTPGDAILSAQEVKEDLQGRTSEPRATHKAWLFRRLRSLRSERCAALQPDRHCKAQRHLSNPAESNAAIAGDFADIIEALLHENGGTEQLAVHAPACQPAPGSGPCKGGNE
jgi:hypothetical protein